MSRRREQICCRRSRRLTSKRSGRSGNVHHRQSLPTPLALVPQPCWWMNVMSRAEIRGSTFRAAAFMLPLRDGSPGPPGRSPQNVVHCGNTRRRFKLLEARLPRCPWYCAERSSRWNLSGVLAGLRRSTFGSGAQRLLSSAYLLPLTALFVLVWVFTLAFRARARRGYGPFALGLVAATLILWGRFSLESNALAYAGVGLLIGSSLWNSWPRPAASQSPRCAPAGGGLVQMSATEKLS